MTPSHRVQDVAGEAWSLMRNLVINNERKREACEETGLSFAKIRALRRIAHRPLSMGELATLLEMDPPNVTTLIDDLERSHLVRRQPHDTDRRVLLVVITASGTLVDQCAQAILERPPTAVSRLSLEELKELRRILKHVI